MASARATEPSAARWRVNSLKRRCRAVKSQWIAPAACCQTLSPRNPPSISFHSVCEDSDNSEGCAQRARLREESQREHAGGETREKRDVLHQWGQVSFRKLSRCIFSPPPSFAVFLFLSLVFSFLICSRPIENTRAERPGKVDMRAYTFHNDDKCVAFLRHFYNITVHVAVSRRAEITSALER